MTRVKVGLALTVLVLVGAAVSCGQAGGEVLAAAGRATTEAGTSRVALSISAHPAAAEVGAGLGEPPGASGNAFRLSAEGLLDYTSGNGMMLFDLTGAGLPIAGEVEMRVIGGTVYLKVPGDEMGGRPWLKMDAGSASAESAVPGLDEPVNDPRAMLDALQAVTGEVEEVGRETVRGTETRHLRGEVDLSQAQDQLPEARRKDFEALREQFGRPTLPLDAWVDDEDRVRRLTYSLEAGGRPLRVELELFDFGVEVVVARPAASEVTEFGELDTAA